MRLRLLLAIAIGGLMLAGSSVAWATDAPTTKCAASASLVYGGNVGGAFNVQAGPINRNGISMKAESGGLRLSLAAPAQDAEVIFLRSTLGDVITHGAGVNASANVFTNLWFDTNNNGQYFDLKTNGTGDFKAVAGDDFGTLTGSGTTQKISSNGGDLLGQETLLTALKAKTGGKISETTKVAIAVGIGAPGASVLVTSVGGAKTVTCTTTTTPPAPPMYADCAAVNAAGKAPLLAGSPGYRLELDSDKDGIACEVDEPAPVVNPPAANTGGNFSQIGTVPQGSVDTGDGSTEQ